MLRLLVLGCLFLISGLGHAQDVDDLVSPAAVDLIVRWEVGSPAQYTRRYSHPIYPGGASGVTIGIGYDLGYSSEKTILHDWKDHPHRGYLAAMSGFKGESAKNLVARRKWIVTPYPLAYQVFLDPTLVRYYNMARRAFPGMENLSLNAQGSLVSLVYNRGSNMLGAGRREMRTIRDVCIPSSDEVCVADMLRKMTRIWKNSTIEKGMTARRFDEAALAVK